MKKILLVLFAVLLLITSGCGQNTDIPKASSELAASFGGFANLVNTVCNARPLSLPLYPAFARIPSDADSSLVFIPNVFAIPPVSINASIKESIFVLVNVDVFATWSKYLS